MNIERACALIDLRALKANVSEIAGVIGGGVKIMAVVKANAYGHGAVECGKAALSAGADWLGVATVSEAIELRESGIGAEILVFGAPAQTNFSQMVNFDLTATVYSGELAEGLSQAAKSMGKKADVHIKIETGMNRVGLRGWVDEELSEILRIFEQNGLNVTGAYTHFAQSMDNQDFTRVQFEAYMETLKHLETRGIKVPLRHVSNSGGVLRCRDYDLDMVRPGTILYGIYTKEEMGEGLSIAPVMKLMARVVHVKEIKAGDTVGYNQTYMAKKTIKVATVSIGYGDGYARSLGNKASAIVGGVLCPVIGIVCMDALMLDVSGANVSVGDCVTLLGRDGEHEISASDVARLLGTNSLEVTTAVNTRPQRQYIM